MPLHKAEPYCLKDKNSKTHDCCSCQHCTLAVCRVCGQYEGGLTQDCPGVKMSSDVGALVHSGGLDYTDERGWFVHHKEDGKYPYHDARFEPTAKGIIQRLAAFKHTVLTAEQSDAFAELRKDAEYWLNNREGRR